LRSDDTTRRVESLEDENRRLKRAVEELTIINDLARAIGASLSSKEIMNTIIRRSLRAVNAEQGVITLVHDRPSEPTKTLVRTMSDSSEHEAFHLDQSLLGWMQINKRPLSMKDPHNDPRFRGLRLDASIKSLLCVPMLVKSELKGVLTVTNKKDADEFSLEDQRLLAIIAGQSAQIVETARLYEEEKALGRVREELRLASEIQLGLLPKINPQVKGYEVAGVSTPAQVVGGDYFDFIPIDDSRLAICLGDVSGKGLPAALLMSNLQATIRGQTILVQSPKECMERSNRLMYQSTDPHKFATLFYGIMDTSSHRLAYSNAGHDLPYFFSGGRDPVRLESGGLILSVMEDFPYEEGVVQFDPGDLLVIYSDGITEASNENEEQYGEGRLEEVLRGSLGLPASELIKKITSSVKEFVGGRPQSDDMTVVVVRRDS
jgi:sigma-B regulation protein RsbU (phosphoserine phosphatase)